MSRKGGTFIDIASPEEGARVVFALIIRQAQVDLLGMTIDGRKTVVPGSARRSAAAYFRGPVYQHHCDLLGLDARIVPEGLKEVMTARECSKTL